MLKTYIKPTIYPGQDCQQGAITNILNYKSYNELKTIWKYCNLVYVRKHDSLELGTLNGSQYSLEEELEWIHNIKAEKIQSKNDNEFKENLKSTLALNEPVILFVDTYYLEHHFGFNKFHAAHIVIATEFIEDKVVCVDDYSKFSGAIPFEQIVKASCIGSVELTYMKIKIEEAKTVLTTEDFKEIINRNIESLTGDNEGAVSLNSDQSTFYGMEGINQFIEDCQKSSTTMEIKKLLENMYNELLKVTHRHSQFTNLLRQRGEVYNDFEDLFQEFYFCSQEWNIVTNMCLKGQFAKDKNMYERVINKLENIYNHETSCLSSLKRQLSNRVKE